MYRFRVTLKHRDTGREIEKPFVGTDADEVWERVANTQRTMRVWTVVAVDPA